MPRFESFDDAWRWFVGGGTLESLDERRAQFLAGRAQFLTFQVSLSDTPVADAIAEVQDQLGVVDGLALMPSDLLHISLRGVGFQMIARTRPDDVLPDEVVGIERRAAEAIATCAPIAAGIGPVNVFPDAVILEVHDAGGLGDLRRRLDALEISDAFGLGDAEYLPHVTIATFREPPNVSALRACVEGLRTAPQAAMTIGRVELARYWFVGEAITDDPERDVVRAYRLRG